MQLSDLGRVHQFETEKNKIYAGAYRKYLKKDTDSLNWDIYPFNLLLNYVKIFHDSLGNVYCYDNNDIYMSSDKGSNWIARDTNNVFGNDQIYECLYNNRVIAGCEDETSGSVMDGE